jgi:hypothetical protein
MVDLFLVYSFIRRLATPFIEWDAYKLGIIDERGNILRKRKDLRLQQERAAFGVFDVLVLNLKKLLERLPAGQTRLASYAAALWLIREWNAFTPGSLLNESLSDDQIQESTELFFDGYTDYNILSENVNQKSRSLNDIFEQRFVDEEVPTNSISAGAVSGLTKDDLPGVSRAQQRRHRKRTKVGRTIIGNKFMENKND